MKYLFIISILLYFSSAFSQVTQKYTSEYEGYYRAEELFLKREMSSAKFEFETFLASCKNANDPFYIKARYYIGLSTLEMNLDEDAVRLFTQFNKDYPENIYKNRIYFKLGNYYFKNDNKNAREWYSKVIVSELSSEDKIEYYFKSGYTHHLLKDNSKAKAAFMDSKNSPTEYGYASKYYYAIILNSENSRSSAFDEFESLKTNSKYGDQAYNFMVQIKHADKKFDYCIDSLSNDKVVKKLSYDNRYLIGDAFYQKQKYADAIPYFENYDSTLRALKLGTSNRNFNYALGNAYYKTGKLSKATEKFNLVLNKQDSLSQITYYQMADIFKQEYALTKDASKLINARTAFEKSAVMDFDKVLQENALYNAAVIAFNVDDSPYNQSVQIFDKFLKLFPNSQHVDEINQFLIEVYRRTNNYELALTTIDKLGKKDFKLKALYQSIAYNYAVTLFQQNDYKEAIYKFKLAQFWIAESILRDFESISRKTEQDSVLLDSALIAYRLYLKEPSGSPAEMRHEAYYQMGYIRLKQLNLTESIEMFRVYIQSGSKDTEKLLDANLRIADSYYMTRKDEEAIKFYQSALDLNAGSQDLALYYMSKSCGFLEKNDKKIELLLKLLSSYKKSQFILPALYDLALAYKDDKADYTNALNYFNKILTDYPKAAFYLDCKIEVADIYFLTNDYAKAEAEYQKILDANLNNNDICLKSATGLKNVYLAKGQTDKVEDLISKYPCAQISSEEIENLYYEPAEKSYTDSLFSAAIPKFETYLSKFPQGRYAAEALFFLGDCYGRNLNSAKKIELYKQLLELPVCSYSESSAAFVSQQLYNSGEYEQAQNYYFILEKISTKPNTQYAAKLGVMRSSFLLQNYDTAAVYSKLILETPNISNSVKVEAEYSKGMSNFQLNNFAEALPSLTWISKNTTTSWASEAQFHIAMIYFIQKDLVKADAEARALLKMKPTYNYWIARALILQSKICIEQNNLFQAEQTINSVLDHYPEKEDGIISEANEVKVTIENLKNGEN
jgi:tetratricopeptide (TPR) repeat protein